MYELMKSAIHLLFTNVFTKFINAFVILFLANKIGVNEYAQLAIGLAIASLFSVLIELGINNTAIREGTKKDSILEKMITEYIFFRIIFYIVFGLFFGTFITYLLYSEYEYIIPIIIMVNFIVLSNVFLGVQMVYYQVTMNIKKYSNVTATISLTTSLGLILVLAISSNLTAICLLYGVVSLVISIVFSSNIIKENFKIKYISKGIDKSLVIGMKHYFINRIANVIRPQMGLFILERIADIAQVGIFSLVIRVINVLYSVPSIIATAFFGTLFKLGNSKSLNETHKMISIFQLRIMSIAGGAMFLAINTNSHWIVEKFFSNEWSNSNMETVLAFFSSILYIQSINQPIGDYLTTSNRQQLRTKSIMLSISMGALYIVSGSYLWGAIGATLGVILMDLTYTLCLLIFSKEFFYILKNGILPSLLPIVITYFIFSITSLNIVLNLDSIFIYIVFVVIYNFRYYKKSKGGILKLKL